MAGSITSGPSGLFDPYTRDQAGADQVLRLALFGGDKGSGDTDLIVRKRITTALKELLKRPDFTVSARSDAAETVALIELIARGVTFPVASGSGATLINYMRVIDVEAYVSGATALTEQGFIKSRWAVVGGATPQVYITQIPATGSTGVPGVGVNPNFAGNVHSALGTTAADTDVPFLTLVSGASTVTLNFVHATTEVMNIVANVYVGKLQPIPGGV